MPSQNPLIFFCNLLTSCLNFIPESFTRLHPYQESTTSASSIGSGLPLSIILEILLKLPIKTIIKSKCVCKSWYDLISDPYFANIYLKNHPFTVLVLSQLRMVADRVDDESFYFLEIGTDGDVFRTPFNPKALDFPKRGILSIMGSCNGFLCLVDTPQIDIGNEINHVYNRDDVYYNQKIYVVNPLMGEFVVLPGVARSFNISNVVYGFGLDASGKHYKILRIVSSYVFQGIGHEYKVQGEILTVGVDDKWRYFEDRLIPFYLFPCGISLNGILHLIGDDRRCGFIFAFDVGLEKGYRIPFPSGLRDDPGNIVLAIWDGNLCITDNNSEVQVDVWTMKQYGVAESWTRDIILKRRIPRDLRPYSFIPITTLRNGELLLSRQNEGDLSSSSPNGQSMFSFDPKRKRCRKVEVSDGAGTVSFLFEYVPGFFPFGNGFPKDECSSSR